MRSLPWQLLGIQVSGDVGPYTIYTDRFGRKVPFPRASPKEPPTGLQLSQRNRFKSAQAQWASQPSTVKAAYEELCNQASLAMTGQNLWISVAMTHDLAGLTTLRNQTGISVPTPPFV